jgi:hypothetical protein
VAKSKKTDFSILLKDFKAAVRKAEKAIFTNKSKETPQKADQKVQAFIRAFDNLQEQIRVTGILFDAASDGNTRTLKDAFAKGVDVNYTNQGGNSLLAYTVAGDQEETMDFLIEQKADLNLSKGPCSFSPIEYATIKDNVRLFNKLAKVGAKEDKEKLIQLAKHNNSNKVLKVLEKRGK